MYRTTTTNLQARLVRIPFIELPPTFRDAVSVCRHLRIRYLWIDSLCIIQDSTADWKHESSTMADVYSRSTLTIADDWSTNPNGGCFYSNRSSIRIDTEDVVCVQSTLSDGRRSSLYFCDHHKEPNLESIEENALSKRAWAFQERLLSPRILHFTQKQLFWECREAFYAEDLVPRNHGSVKPGFVLKMRGWPNIKSKLHVWCT